MQATQDDRYARGWRKLQEIDGDAGQRVIESLRDIAPDLGRFVVEFPFGDIYSRPGLDLRSREIATVAALAAMGNATAQCQRQPRGAYRGHHPNGHLCRLPGSIECHVRCERSVCGEEKSGLSCASAVTLSTWLLHAPALAGQEHLVRGGGCTKSSSTVP